MSSGSGSAVEVCRDCGGALTRPEYVRHTVLGDPICPGCLEPRDEAAEGLTATFGPLTAACATGSWLGRLLKRWRSH